MHRFAVAVIFAFVALAAWPRLARATDDTTKAKGMAVVAVDGSTDAAWPLARGVYGSALLKPNDLSDAYARVLAGEAPAADAPQELKDLAEYRGGIRGDDAASRQLLSAIADRLAVKSIIVVFPGESWSARVFDAASRTFDAARYAPDSGEEIRWDGAIRSLERPFSPTPLPVVVGPTQALPKLEPVKKDESKPFYASPWFWAAIGAAVLIGGGVLIATNLQSGDNIHLQMRFP